MEAADSALDGFDVCLHLAGEEAIPNYIGIKLAADAGCRMHVLAVSRRTAGQAERVRQAFGEGSDVRIESVEIDAWDYWKAIDVLRGAVSRLGGGPGGEARFGFNLTGGTKVMALAAKELSAECGAIAFYLNTEGRKIVFFSGERRVAQMPPVFDSVETIFRLAGLEMLESGKGRDDAELAGAERAELAKLFWRHRAATRPACDEFCKAWAQRNKSKERFAKAFKKAAGKLSKLLLGCGAKEVFRKWKSHFGEDLRSATEFARGGWFEEWLFGKFREETTEDEVRDLRLNVKLPPVDDGKKRKRRPPNRELDIVYTDGYDLVIWEAKAGVMERGFLDKLSAIRKNTGGRYGKAVLAVIDAWREGAADNEIEDRKDWVRDAGLPVVCGTALEEIARQRKLKNGTIYHDAGDFAEKMRWERKNAVADAYIG